MASTPVILPRVRQEGPNVAPVGDERTWNQALCEILNVEDTAWGAHLLQTVLNAVPRSDQDNAQLANTIIAGLAEMKPRDGIEALLSVQAVATHLHVMNYLAKAASSNLAGVSEERLRMAAKLMKLFMLQLQTLGKYRNAGRQHVRVEHVTVNAGGQAIVGNIGEGGHA